MANQVTQEERWRSEDEQLSLEAARIEPTFPMPATQAPTGPTTSNQSYYETRWPVVNRALAMTEQVTNGRAGLIQRLFTYLLIGGTAALVNLGILALFFHYGSAKVLWYWLVANVVAYEVSIMANFIPNDYFTFRHLDGHNRSWWARCLRFHSTSAAGTIATLVMSFAFKTWLGMSALIAEAVAIMLALILNFTMHHLWTYRQIKGDDDSDAVQVDGSLVVSEARGQAR